MTSLWRMWGSSKAAGCSGHSCTPTLQDRGILMSSGRRGWGQHPQGALIPTLEADLSSQLRLPLRVRVCPLGHLT